MPRTNFGFTKGPSALFWLSIAGSQPLTDSSDHCSLSGSWRLTRPGQSPAAPASHAVQRRLGAKAPSLMCLWLLPTAGGNLSRSCQPGLSVALVSSEPGAGFSKREERKGSRLFLTWPCFSHRVSLPHSIPWKESRWPLHKLGAENY